MDEAGLLFDIMQQFDDPEVILTTQQVAQILRKDPRVVSGMLETLVHVGKLAAVDSHNCDLCPLRAACSIPDASTQCYRLRS